MYIIYSQRVYIILKGPSVVKLNDGSQKAKEEVERAEKEKRDKESIWGEAEIPTEDAVYSVRSADQRPQPRYEFSYKQVL
jgi:hypothetical protein